MILGDGDYTTVTFYFLNGFQYFPDAFVAMQIHFHLHNLSIKNNHVTNVSILCIKHNLEQPHSSINSLKFGFSSV